MEFKVLINNVDFTEFVSLPFNEQLTLDASLDFGSLKLNYTDIKEPFKPFTNVEINVKHSEAVQSTLYYFVSNDKWEEVIQGSVYNHTLLLIEQTKWLERFLGRTHPITQPIEKNYTQDAVMYTQTDNITDKISYGKKDLFITPSVKGEYNLPSLKKFYDLEGYAISGGNGYVHIFKNGVKQFEKIVAIGNEETLIGSFYFTDGQYKIVYHYENYIDSYESFNYTTTFYLDIITDGVNKLKKTITSEVNNVLQTIETLQIGETPRFSFNKEQAEKYKDTLMPEITLTGTLFEQLNQIGQCINAIPRLRNNIIYFDELGKEEVAEILTLTGHPFNDYISSTTTFDIEQYAVAIDSNIDNFVNTDNEEVGSIVEPYNDGYKTVRTESTQVQITDTNAFIETTYPIEKILKVEVGIINDNGDLGGDITDFIYSGAEYESFSSVSNSYPFSKLYALKYEVGQRNITGLSFKVPNPVHEVFSRYAIEYIINKARELRGLPEVKVKGIRALQFRVTYIPIINGRAKQYREDVTQVPIYSTLAYNQSSQKISATAMGKAMKGAIERLGNPEKVKVYVLPTHSFDTLKCGDKFDEEYYISVIKREYYPDFVKMELGLSKNFNKLSEFVGVDKQIRFYEISETQVVNTQILYEEFCVIGDENENFDTNCKVNILSIGNSLINGNNNKRITVARVQGTSGVDDLTKVILPVVSYSIGNSVLMTFKYEDNYSAGLRVIREGSTILQYQIPYTDSFGEIDNLNIEYGWYVKTQNYDYEEGDAVPTTDGIDYGNFANNFNLNVVINKESRAIPTFNYMLHFVTNRSDIVIGEGMAKYSYLVKDTTSPAKLYVLDKKLSKFDNIINEGTEIASLENVVWGYGDNFIELVNGFVSTVNGKSWALVKEVNGQNHLLFGQNKEISANDTINLPKLNFTHILY